METPARTYAQYSDHCSPRATPRLAERTSGSTDKHAEVRNGVVPDLLEQTGNCQPSGATVDLTHELALATARAEELERELDLLRVAMNTRNIIGQAQGLLMERYGVDADEAFSMLVRLSQRSHVKLRDVAARLVQGRNESGEPRRSRRRHE